MKKLLYILVVLALILSCTIAEEDTAMSRTIRCWGTSTVQRVKTCMNSSGKAIPQ